MISESPEMIVSSNPRNHDRRGKSNHRQWFDIHGIESTNHDIKKPDPEYNSRQFRLL
jgi:hypothetical protein